MFAACWTLVPVGVLDAGAADRRDRRQVARVRLGHALVGCANRGALRVDVGVVQIGLDQGAAIVSAPGPDADRRQATAARSANRRRRAAPCRMKAVVLSFASAHPLDSTCRLAHLRERRTPLAVVQARHDSTARQRAKRLALKPFALPRRKQSAAIIARRPADATQTSPMNARPNGAFFRRPVANMRHFDGAAEPIRDPRTGESEHEARRGLESVQRVGAPPRTAPAGSPPRRGFVERGLGRAHDGVDPDQTAAVGELLDQGVGPDPEGALDDDDVERSRDWPRPPRAGPRSPHILSAPRAAGAPPQRRRGRIRAPRPSRP